MWEPVFEKIIAENFPKLIEDMNPHTQEAQDLSVMRREEPVFWELWPERGKARWKYATTESVSQRYVRCMFLYFTQKASLRERLKTETVA